MPTTPPNAAPQHAYRPDVDGLRAVAVLVVVLFHAFPNLVPGGFIGVDIFFVISGYLITGILQNDLDQGRFSLARFYARRVRRIFPALLAVAAAVTAVGWFLMLPNEFRLLAEHLAGGATFSSNFLLWNESGYFDASAESKPLLHLWSLAIEEQFYLLWPLVLAALWRGRRNLLLANALLFAASFAANLLLVRHEPTAAYYLPLSRFWELLAGAQLAHLHQRGIRLPPAGGQIASTAGALLVGIGLFAIDKSTAFPGWWALLPVVGSFLLLGAPETSWVNRWILSHRILVSIGLVSYPLYLWHWPILSFLRINFGETPFPSVRLAGVALSLGLAAATYLWIERRVRFHPSPRTVPALLGGLVAVLAIGLLVRWIPVPPRHHGPEIDGILQAADEWTFPGALRAVPDQVDLHELPAGNTETVLYIGDSHMEQYVDRITDVAKAHPSRALGVQFSTKGGCPPLPGVRRESDPACTEAVERAFARARTPSVRRVVVGGCWNCFLKFPPPSSETSTEYSVETDGRRLPLNQPEGRRAALANLGRALDRLPPDKEVYLLLDNPKAVAYDPEARLLGNRIWNFRIAPSVDSVAADTAELALRSELLEFARRRGIRALDPRTTQCTADRCVATLPDGTPVYSDEHHYRTFFVKSRAAFLDSTVLLR